MQARNRGGPFSNILSLHYKVIEGMVQINFSFLCCQKANCPNPGTPDNGNYQKNMDGFYHNVVVTYFCDTNFDLNGNDKIMCDNGEWDGAMPNCTGIYKSPKLD